MTAQNKIILVDGATGYLGSHLVHRLSQNGHHIRCLVRYRSNQEDLDFLKNTGAKIFFGSLDEDSSELRAAFAKASCVVHLIGSIAPRRGEKLVDLHGGQTANLVKHSQDNDIGKIVLVTALGTSANANNNYHHSKWQSEKIVEDSGVTYTVLRPSLLIGHTVGHRDSKLVKRLIDIILSKKAVPLVGGGKNKIQPLFIDDMVSVLVGAISNNSNLANRTFELGGPDIMTMRQFVLSLMAVLKVSKPIINLHPVLASVIALGLERIQDIPLMTYDQVKLSLTDNICHSNAISSVFGIDPTPLAIALKTYAEAEKMKQGSGGNDVGIAGADLVKDEAIATRGAAGSGGNDGGVAGADLIRRA